MSRTSEQTMKLLHTPLYEKCLEIGGKMGPFANWEMPLTFSGLIQEHNSVRRDVGMFDISHMGVLLLKGKHLKIKYVTQVHHSPPILAFYTNYPDLFPIAYKRYLENRLRNTFGFDGVPIKISFRENK